MNKFFLTSIGVFLLNLIITAQQKTRSTETGQYVSKSEASKHPNTTVTESGGNKSNHNQSRDAGTGKFVSKDYSDKNSNTTQTEHSKRGKK
ncbi:MAG: hypothetical protein ABIP51_02235 [Bacteroidia bacterium]